MFAEHIKLITKTRKVALQPAQAFDDFFRSLFYCHAFKAEHNRLQVCVKAVRRNRYDAFAHRIKA
jgi:hypothetical protein